MRNDRTIDTDYLPLWPLCVVIEDCYVPELAAQALEIAETVSVETFGAQCEVEARWTLGQAGRN